MAPTPWNDKSDRDLLLALLLAEDGALKGVKWDVISAKMTAQGYNFSNEACRQHFQKLRKESRANGGRDSNGADGAGARANGNGDTLPKTPRSTTKVKVTPMKRSKSATEPGEGGNDDDKISTPSKRPKKDEHRENVTQFKIEANGHAGSHIELDQDDLYDEDA
ncbi:hypothetical protein B0O99DRAFT_626936 [Bisporella sp. PMI_857]|nr:hypothetical protein B0O99DRAFT_626936 [Bisporella sp. PMI_857]